MTKDSGLGANFYLDGIDLSGDVGEMSTITKSIKVINMTGIDKFAFERKAGQLDGEISWKGFFNPTNAHLKLEDLPRIDVIGSYVHKAADLGTPVANLISKQMNYDGERGSDGELNFSTQLLANAQWLDWGYSLTTGKRTDTAAANGTGVDFAIQGAPASFGLQAYLQVFAFTGTSVTITLQGSSDNAVGDPYANITGGAFTVVSSSPLSQRIATARNQAIERYIRVVTTGTFSNLVFAVAAVVNVTDMTI